MEDEADGASNCLSWIPFLCHVWLNFYLRIAHVTVVSGFSSGIGMWHKWKAIPKTSKKHVNYRSRSYCVATIRVFVYCFIMEMMCKWVSAKPIQPNGPQTITATLPIFLSISASSFFFFVPVFYFVRVCGWGVCPADTFWAPDTHISIRHNNLIGSRR